VNFVPDDEGGAVTGGAPNVIFAFFTAPMDVDGVGGVGVVPNVNVVLGFDPPSPTVPNGLSFTEPFPSFVTGGEKKTSRRRVSGLRQ